MALKYLCHSESPLYLDASQCPETHSGSSSFQTRSSLWADGKAHPGGHSGLVQHGAFSKSMSGSLKRTVFKAFQAGKWLLNTTPEDTKCGSISNLDWQEITFLLLGGGQLARLLAMSCLLRALALKVFVDNLLPAMPKNVLVSPVPFLQKVGVKSNS